MTLPPFYPILDSDAAERLNIDVVDAARQIVEAGAQILQFRHKGFLSRAVFEAFHRVAEVCGDAGAECSFGAVDGRVDVIGSASTVRVAATVTGISSAGAPASIITYGTPLTSRTTPTVRAVSTNTLAASFDQDASTLNERSSVAPRNSVVGNFELLK